MGELVDRCGHAGVRVVHLGAQADGHRRGRGHGRGSGARGAQRDGGVAAACLAQQAQEHGPAGRALGDAVAGHDSERPSVGVIGLDAEIRGQRRQRQHEAVARRGVQPQQRRLADGQIRQGVVAAHHGGGGAGVRRQGDAHQAGGQPGAAQLQAVTTGREVAHRCGRAALAAQRRPVELRAARAAQAPLGAIDGAAGLEHPGATNSHRNVGGDDLSAVVQAAAVLQCSVRRRDGRARCCGRPGSQSQLAALRGVVEVGVGPDVVAAALRQADCGDLPDGEIAIAQTHANGVGHDPGRGVRRHVARPFHGQVQAAGGCVVAAPGHQGVEASVAIRAEAQRIHARALHGEAQRRVVGVGDLIARLIEDLQKAIEPRPVRRGDLQHLAGHQHDAEEVDIARREGAVTDLHGHSRARARGKQEVVGLAQAVGRLNGGRIAGARRSLDRQVGARHWACGAGRWRDCRAVACVGHGAHAEVDQTRSAGRVFQPPRGADRQLAARCVEQPQSPCRAAGGQGNVELIAAGDQQARERHVQHASRSAAQGKGQVLRCANGDEQFARRADAVGRVHAVGQGLMGERQLLRTTRLHANHLAAQRHVGRHGQIGATAHRLRASRPEQAKAHRADSTVLALQAQHIGTGGQLHRAGLAILAVQTAGTDWAVGVRPAQIPNQATLRRRELIPLHWGGAVHTEAVLHCVARLGQRDAHGLAQGQVELASRIAPQRKTVIQRGDRARAAFDRHPVGAAACGREDDTVAGQRHACPDRHGLRVEEREAAAGVAGDGLHVQAVTDFEIDAVQRCLRAGGKLARHWHAVAHRAGGFNADELEDVVAGAVTDAGDGEVVGARVEVDEAVAGAFQAAKAELVGRVRALELPAHLGALHTVKQEATLLGQRELEAVLLAGLIDRAFDPVHAWHGIGRQQQLGLKGLDLPRLNCVFSRCEVGSSHP